MPGWHLFQTPQKIPPGSAYPEVFRVCALWDRLATPRHPPALLIRLQRIQQAGDLTEHLPAVVFELLCPTNSTLDPSPPPKGEWQKNV